MTKIRGKLCWHHMRMEFRTLSFYRDLFAEFLSTFFLVLSAFSLGMTWGDKPNTGTVVHIGIGMMCAVCVLAWSLGEFGGTHMNPCVTLALILLSEITPSRALLYVIIQCAAAMAGVKFLKVVLPALVTDHLKPTVLHPDLEPWQGSLIEGWLTFQLILTVLGAINEKRTAGGLCIPPLIISMAVAASMGSGLASTGCSMNPALTLGAAVVTDIWDDHWLYWVGPLSGSMVATATYKLFFDVLNHSDRRLRAGRYCIGGSYSPTRPAGTSHSRKTIHEYRSDGKPETPNGEKVYNISERMQSSKEQTVSGTQLVKRH